MEIQPSKEDYEELKKRAEEIIKAATKDIIIWTEILKQAERHLKNA